jgi:hypothetical protein
LKDLEDWFNNLFAIVVGVVVTGLWGFRERVHADRYEKMTARLSSLEKDFERMEIESSVMAERVSHMADGQKEIQTDVKAILQTLNTMVGSCSVCDNNSKRIK